MFSHERIEIDRELFQVTIQDYAAKFHDSLDVLIKIVENRSFYWSVESMYLSINCISRLALANDPRLTTFVQTSFDFSNDLVRWFIPFEFLSKKLTVLTRKLEGQLLQGWILQHFVNYVEQKLIVEMIRHIVILGAKNDFGFADSLTKYFKNFFRRRTYQNSAYEDHIIQVDLVDDIESLIDVTNEKFAKSTLLKMTSGEVDKYFAYAVYRGTERPQQMSETYYLSILCDFLLPFLKDVNIVTFDRFYDTDALSSYECGSDRASYRKYQARRIKSLLRRDKNWPS
jgi:hypothetical protein